MSRLVRGESVPKQWEDVPLKTREEMFWGISRQPEDAQWDMFTKLTLQRANTFLYKTFVARRGGSPHTPWRFGLHWGYRGAQRLAYCNIQYNRPNSIMMDPFLELSEPVEEFISETLYTKLLLVCQKS